MGLFDSAGDAPEVQVKSLGELTGEATSANISQLPNILQAFEQFGPGFGAAALRAFEEANPTISQNIKQLGSVLGQRLQDVAAGGIPGTLRTAALSNIRAGQAARGTAISPISAVSEAQQLAEVGETFAQNTIQGSLAFGGLRQGQTPGLEELGLDLPSIQQQVQTGQQVDIRTQEAAATNFARQEEARKLQNAQRGTAAGAIIGGTIGLAGGPVGAIQGAQAGRQLATLF